MFVIWSVENKETSGELMQTKLNKKDHIAKGVYIKLLLYFLANDYFYWGEDFSKT